MKIEHSLMPGFVMKVIEERPCEEPDSAPDEKQYLVIDPEGQRDWLCSRDVRIVQQ